MSVRTLKDVGERGLVRLIRRLFPAGGKGVQLGIGDDAAVLRPSGRPDVLTKDLLVENVDFLRGHPPYELGRKSLNVNLSDLAAMGASPAGVLLGLGLPGDLDLAWIRAFLRGVRSAAGEAGAPLVGGDISMAAEIVISVTAVGRGDRIVRRDGARPGDLVFVSGTLGDAAFGLALLGRRGRAVRSREERAAVRAFLDPVPKIGLGRALARRGLASAMIDISDGLSVDLRHIGEESGVGAEIELDRIPLSPALRALDRAAALDYALNGGEDFELLFTVRPSRRSEDALAALGRRFPLTRIGRITARRGFLAVDARGRRTRLRARGYEHFRKR